MDPPHVAIPIKIDCDYVRKAKGVIRAECKFEFNPKSLYNQALPGVKSGDPVYVSVVDVLDKNVDDGPVCTVRVYWSVRSRSNDKKKEN
jgi:hypothetical protein